MMGTHFPALDVNTQYITGQTNLYSSEKEIDIFSEDFLYRHQISSLYKLLFSVFVNLMFMVNKFCLCENINRMK